MARILLVDDDASVLFALRELVESHGHEAVAVASGGAALEALDGVDVVVSDYTMPGMDGMQLLEHVLAYDSTLPVIIVTAHGSERLAVTAMKHSAYDYLTKPFDNDEVFYSIERAIETRRLRLDKETRLLEHDLGVRPIGDSPAMTRTLEAVRRVANKDVTVLIRGETGTGKELIAALLHARSQRAKTPLVVFNSATIPPNLAEAQLFGHAKGAFTGAVTSHVGHFMRANGGTLFLDEIGELRLDVQAKLLRVLQEHEIQPVGESRVEKVDVRVIAATHRDLLGEVRAGRFREDLYYRIAVVELVVPSLRERRSDIPQLAREFARKYSERFGLGYVVQLTPELVTHLETEAWPGNVRQLENTIARCIALAGGNLIGLETLHAGRDLPVESESGSQHSFREQVEAFERNLIRSALTGAGGNQSETARRLHMNRASLYDKLKKYGLTSGGSDS